jgi:hypothetical protein
VKHAKNVAPVEEAHLERDAFNGNKLSCLQSFAFFLLNAFFRNANNNVTGRIWYGSVRSGS